MLLFFIIVNGVVVTGKSFLAKWNINQDVMIIGNLILLVVTIGSFFLISRSLNSSNPNSFVRAMYGSFMIKFFLIAGVAAVYILVTKKNVNKVGLIACVGLYFIYTFIEVAALTKLLKQKKNA